MPDRKKVIKKLETEIQDFSPACTSDERLKETMEMALELLKGSTISGWVSVKDRLPCNTQDVLVYAKGLLVKIGAYIVQSNEWWVFGLGGEYIVEYWMPLPEPPEEVLNGNEH